MFLSSSLTLAQTVLDTIYLDLNWEKGSSNNYEYFRILTQKIDGTYGYEDYWKSGELQNTGQLSLLFPETQEGECRWYQKNGRLREIRNYQNNKIIGQGQIYDTLGKFDFYTIYSIDSLDNSSEVHVALSKVRNHLAKNLNPH